MPRLVYNQPGKQPVSTQKRAHFREVGAFLRTNADEGDTAVLQLQHA